jgi:Uma2 family endonuclease
LIPCFIFLQYLISGHSLISSINDNFVLVKGVLMTNTIPAKTIGNTGVALPPTQLELPYDDNTTMETQRHKVQMELLIDTLFPWLDQRPDGYIGGNMFVYYSLTQARNSDFKGPDFFVVLDVPKGERLSWVVWEEGKAPDIIIELLSESTAKADKDEKKLVYQNKLRVPEYFWFDPFDPSDWAGFSWQNQTYQPINPNAQGQLVSQVLGLALVKWQGDYKGVKNITWLRWATLDGQLLPNSEEIAEQEKLRAEQEKLRADNAESQLQQVAANLLKQGMTLEQVTQLTGLSESEVAKLSS